MATYRDLDKSGSYRTVDVNMGPTFGTVRVPVSLERTVTTPGDITIQPWDAVIIVNQTLSAPINIILPKASVWYQAIYGGTTIVVKDGAGVAAAANISLSLFAGDVIQGPSVIQQALGSLEITPLADLTGWSTISGVRL